MGFFIALQFLTSIPLPIKRRFSAMEIGRSMAYFPLVGLFLGLVWVGLDGLLGLILPGAVVNALLIAALIALTGALHLDGFIDCCDGLLCAKSPEERLEILRDTQIGAFGAVGVISLLLLKYAALGGLVGPLRQRILLLAPVLSRWSMVYAARLYPYARTGQGVGRMFSDHVTRRDLATASLTAALAALLSLGWRGLIPLAVTWLLTVALIRWIMGRIPGLTGDTYGAINEIVEVGVLVVFCARSSIV
ncbi:MAG: adenosylcobinamide-GDP ribazoletransferase [Anaerolineae bacterium]